MRKPHCSASLVIVLLALITVLFPGAAPAAEVHGRSSTQYLWYNDMVDGSKQADVVEYLLFSMSGLDSGNRISLAGYGRLTWDVKDVKPGEDSVEDRIYYLYGDIKEVLDDIDVRIGRQFVNLSAGSALLDGAQVTFRNVGPMGFVVAGGRDVRFGEVGVLTSHVSSIGVAAYLSGYKNTDLDISYLRSYDYSDVARDIAGISFKQYLLESVKIYADARYDLTAESVNEALGGVKYFPLLDLMLTAEYYESYPTFDSTSIFSVFAVNKYQEAVAAAQYTLTSWLDLSAAYYHEEFGDDGRAAVSEAGLKLRPSPALTVGLFHDNRRGYGGDLDGVKAYAEYTKPGAWKAGAGVDLDVYERDDMTGQETARKYWAAGRYTLSRSMSASARVENNVNVNYTRDMRGRVTFDYDF